MIIFYSCVEREVDDTQLNKVDSPAHNKTRRKLPLQDRHRSSIRVFRSFYRICSSYSTLLLHQTNKLRQKCETQNIIRIIKQGLCRRRRVIVKIKIKTRVLDVVVMHPMRNNVIKVKWQH
jgi:hypothetical protein